MSGASDVVRYIFSLDEVARLHHRRFTVRDDGGSTPLERPLVDESLHKVGEILARGIPFVQGEAWRNRTHSPLVVDERNVTDMLVWVLMSVNASVVMATYFYLSRLSNNAFSSP